MPQQIYKQVGAESSMRAPMQLLFTHKQLHTLSTCCQWLNTTIQQQWNQIKIINYRTRQESCIVIIPSNNQPEQKRESTEENSTRQHICSALHSAIVQHCSKPSNSTFCSNPQNTSTTAAIGIIQRSDKCSKKRPWHPTRQTGLGAFTFNIMTRMQVRLESMVTKINSTPLPSPTTCHQSTIHMP